MKQRILIIFLSVLCTFAAQATIVQDTVYINRDTATVEGYFYHVCAFNFDTIYDPTNAIFYLGDNDTLELEVINRDTVNHTFTIDGEITTGNIISPGGSANFEVALSISGTYRYYSESPLGSLLGASGHLLKGYESYTPFYWNFFDQEDSTSIKLGTGAITTLPANYHPQAFTINGFMFPNTTTDPWGHVTGNVGDTLVISMVNSGNMKHSIHFHGYHVTILQSHQRSDMEGWIKDTFVVGVGEGITVMLVPHQEGAYPVHDHNLIAVTTAGVYPGGMITVLNINP